MLIFFYHQGMTALAHASSNGHIKVEKHIWIYNWNKDIVFGNGVVVGGGVANHTTTRPLTDEERIAMEIQMTARKYKDQYKTKAKNQRYNTRVKKLSR